MTWQLHAEHVKPADVAKLPAPDGADPKQFTAARDAAALIVSSGALGGARQLLTVAIVGHVEDHDQDGVVPANVSISVAKAA